MAWTTMHFAVGMGCAGAAAAAACFIFRRGWRFMPAAMTFGGVWALIPDLPRIFREDFPSLPFASLLGSKDLERTLHDLGDLFCFHRALDAQPKEYALAGLMIILLLYNASIALLMFLEHRQRHSLANRMWQAHAPFIERRRRRKRPVGAMPGLPAIAKAAATDLTHPPPITTSHDPDDPVIHRIRPTKLDETA